LRTFSSRPDTKKGRGRHWSLKNGVCEERPGAGKAVAISWGCTSTDKPVRGSGNTEGGREKLLNGAEKKIGGRGTGSEG